MREWESGNHSVRVCLCVSQPCACLCLFGHKECAALSRVVLHVTHLVPKGDERRTSRAQVPPPWVRHTTGFPETLLSTPRSVAVQTGTAVRTDLPSHLVSEARSGRCCGKVGHIYASLLLPPLEVWLDLTFETTRPSRREWSTIRFLIGLLLLAPSLAVSETVTESRELTR